MSTVTTVINTNNQLVSNYDVSKFLLGFNSGTKETFTDGGAGTALLEGLVVGRIAATGKVVPLDKTAVDGSQYPVGICTVSQNVTASATVQLNLVNKGKVALEKVNFKAGTAITDIVDGRQLGDWLTNSLNLILVSDVELTDFDNQ